MITLEYDDLIYSLQTFGGASVYWKQMTRLVAQDDRFDVSHFQSRKIQRAMPHFSNKNIFHSSHFRSCISRKTMVATTVHDLTYELGHVGDGPGVFVNIMERRLSYFTADALICISESTKNDLLNIYPILEKRCPIYVIHHGFTPLIPTGADKSNGNPYILYVGARHGYKNFIIALDAFRKSELWKEGMIFICSGTEFDDNEKEYISSIGLTDYISSTGRLSENELANLYAKAFCLIYPSTYEGFGLPPLEAMSLSCPVIACDVSSIPEIAGDAAMLLKPTDADGMAIKMIELTNNRTRNDYIAKGLDRVKRFSWEKSAKAHSKVYIDLMK